ncbi:MAG: hypothetical protein JXA79_12485 [Deltaproteobacteria bacterium]|nr:hypothetical protein [Deltaproteobacteria bacterium]
MNITDLERVKEKVATLLQSNRYQEGMYRYTRISAHKGAPPVYVNQWLWDSCFHAIIWRWIDLKMAEDELISLISRQVEEGPDKGMIPHTNYWVPDRENFWNVSGRSEITQPPLIAVACKRVYEKSKNKELLRKLFPSICAFHEWFDRRRDPDKDHLVCILHPWESGWDASPRWDQALGIDSFTHQKAREKRISLLKTLQKIDFNATASAEQNLFYVKSIDYNSIRCADIEDLAWIAKELGEAEDAVKWQKKADQIRSAIIKRMFIGNEPFDLEGKNETPIKQESAAQFITLFGGCAHIDQADYLFNKLQKGHFFTAYPVPTTPISEKAYNPDIYWRGNMWLNVNWLIYRGLKRYGYHEVASEIARRSIRLVEKFGYYEFFNPESGEGLGAPRYSWSGIVLDMLASEQKEL